MSRKKTDVEKERYWGKVIQEAARSGMSTREFCRRRRINEHQFYWWRHRLSEGVRRQQANQAAGKETKANPAATFALVSTEAGSADAGIELVLEGGRRLRISKGVDEATLRTVLAAMEQERC
jgi:transposase-like protein